MQAIEDEVRKLGINTFPIPLGLKRNEADPLSSKCIRCDTCDGYPCLVHAKADADIDCIRKILHLPNVTPVTNSRATRLITNSTGTAVTGVDVIHSGTGHNEAHSSSTTSPASSEEGHVATYTADLFVRLPRDSFWKA